MSEEKTQRLVLSVIDFLNVAIKDGTVKEDDREGLEVAVQCIGEAFGVDPSNKEQSDRLSIKPASLPTIFDLFLKTREKLSGPAAGSSSRSVPTPQPAGPSAADKAEAERHKKEGNVLMSQKSYDAAIESYSRSIELDGQNPVYYSNRAAAYSSKGDHEKAVVDAEAAISADPTFVKAYHRLGHAHYTLGNTSDAVSAFERGLAIDPSNAALQTGLESAQAKAAQSSETSPTVPSPSGAAGGPNFADMLRNFGGGAGGAPGPGGMPDLASLMNNPMMSEMARNMMANGGLDRLLSNPSVANMMERMSSGGGMPSMQELMSDPTMRELAQNLTGNAGGRP